MPIAAVPEIDNVRWLIAHLWADQACGVVGGEPKSFKSFLAIYFGLCIAAGVPAFGRFPTTKGRVLVFNAEDRPHMTRRRVARMCCALDLDLASLDLQLIDVPALRIDQPGTVDQLRATVEREKPALLILDPLRDLHGLDENDAGLVSSLLAPLRLLQRDFGCSVMVVHHLSKTTQDNTRRPGQRLRGSSALHGWLDSALYLTRAVDDRVNVQVEHREAAVPEPFAFKLRELVLDIGPALWLELAEATKLDPASDATKVLDALAGARTPVSAKALRMAVGNHDRADAAIKALAESGKIELFDYVHLDSIGRKQKLRGWRMRGANA